MDLQDLFDRMLKKDFNSHFDHFYNKKNFSHAATVTNFYRHSGVKFIECVEGSSIHAVIIHFLISEAL